MGEKEFNIQELKLTAMLYAGRPGVVDHVRRIGHLTGEAVHLVPKVGEDE